MDLPNAPGRIELRRVRREPVQLNAVAVGVQPAALGLIELMSVPSVSSPDDRSSFTHLEKVRPVLPRTVRLSFAASVAVALLFVALPSMADPTKDQCVDANAKGQDLRRATKFSAAREQLRLCTAPSCPAIVRNDCTKRLDELESMQPSVIFYAKDGAGKDVSVVNVTIDGRLLATKLDGTLLQVDPGEHTFVFTVAGQEPVTQTLIVREGDADRRERVVIGPPQAPSPAESAAPTPLLTPPATAHDNKTQKLVGLVLGGVGVAGLIAGGVFGGLTIVETNKQTTDCASNTLNGCNNLAQANSDHSMAITDRTISIAGLAAGGALLVTGAILFLTGRQPSDSPAVAGMLLLPTVGPGSGGISLRGEF